MCIRDRCKGYRILHRNFRCRAGEIDLVALKGRILHFIEVKTRQGDSYGHPAESITPKKMCIRDSCKDTDNNLNSYAVIVSDAVRMGKQSAAADTSHSINQRIKGGHKWAQQNEFQELSLIHI